MTSKWEGRLRCHAWNIWPEKARFCLPPLEIDYGATSPLPVEANITTFTQGTEPTGAPLWDGEVPGLHRRLRNFILRTPENPITQPHLRRARSGELDIWFSFDFDLDPPDALVEALRSKAYQILALLNLGLGDFLIPVLPFQIREMLPGDQASLKFRMDIAVQAQQELSDSKLIETQMGTAHFLTDPSFGEKYRVALELYAAHITEAQVRVRFILLVIAMEALSEKTYKHQVARDLLHRWKQELKAEKSKYDRSSEEFKSLNDLHSEIKWRGESSLGDGIRKLFVGLPAVTEEELEELQRRAMVVYRKRSTLVHEGYVPVEELPGLEREARELLEVLFSAAMKQSEPEDDRFTIVVEDHPPGPASGGDNE